VVGVFTGWRAQFRRRALGSRESSTPGWMGALYRELRHGQDPAEALPIAKLSLLHSDTAYKKPFYGAPFRIYRGF
jgi:CHAT domain-containing protein